MKELKTEVIIAVDDPTPIAFLNLYEEGDRFLKRIENSTQEEEKHGAIKKAKSVSELLKNVFVLVAFRYGPNIIRIKKRFVPIISREKNIEKTLNKVKLFSNKIKSEIEKEKGIDKDIIYIKK